MRDDVVYVETEISLLEHSDIEYDYYEKYFPMQMSIASHQTRRRMQRPELELMEQLKWC